MSTRRLAGFGSAFVVAATAAVAIFRPAASGSAAATLTVRAADVWQDAAVDVAAGEPLEIRYITGTWTINVAGRWFDADGYPGYYPRDIQGACALAPLPDEQNGALIGRIGGGPPFLIGNHKALVADRPGALQMRMNDADACAPDNGGAVEVAIDRGAGATAPATAPAGTTTPPSTSTAPSPAYPPPPTAWVPAYPGPATATPGSAGSASDPTRAAGSAPPGAATAVPPGSAAAGAPPARLPRTGGPGGFPRLEALAGLLIALGLGTLRRHTKPRSSP